MLMHKKLQTIAAHWKKLDAAKFSKEYFAAFDNFFAEEKMKRVFSILAVSVSFIALLSGCNGNKTQISESISTSFKESSPESNTVFSDFIGDYHENPISLLNLSKDEIQNTINAQPNMKCSDKLVYQYTRKRVCIRFQHLWSSR